MIGESLGPYKILEPLGAGGMGEVYLGEDTRLGRKVAIKVLPEEFASDPERLARFEQEARAAAALNHPHIAVVHDVGSEPGEDGIHTHFMVQEYLEGHTLRTPLDKGPLALPKALQLAAEVAEALAAAHGAGIIHRDLKPDNIFVTEDGHAKVLDFGLAKLTDVAVTSSPDAASASASKSPTMLGTVAGQVMGTAGYMAPEQVRGEEVDHRADLFSFGCVLYQMVSGRQPFSGRSVLQTLDMIVNDEPPSLIAPAALPAQIHWILRKCLAKDPARRFQHADDLVVDMRTLRVEVESGTARPAESASPGADGTASKAIPAVAGSRPRWFVPAAIATSVLLSAAATTWIVRSLMAPAPAVLSRFVIEVPASERLATIMQLDLFQPLAISPDGTQVVYATTDPNVSEANPVACPRCPSTLELYLRRIGEFTAEPIAGSEGGFDPTFSPDGQWIAFNRGDGLYKVSVTGGAPQPIVEGPGPRGGTTWGDNTIVYATSRGLMKVAATGGAPEPLGWREGEAGEPLYWPAFLPGTEHVLVTRRTTSTIALVDTVTGQLDDLGIAGSHARYVPTGHIVYAFGDGLFAVPFNLATFATSGAPAPVLSDVSYGGGGVSRFAVASETGTLIYLPATGGNRRRLVWVDRSGNPTPTLEEERNYETPRLSPQGDRIAFTSSGRDGVPNVWIAELRTNSLARLTVAGDGTEPLWSPDGEWVYFASSRDSVFEFDTDVFRRKADFTGSAEKVLTRDLGQWPLAASADGLITAVEFKAETSWDIIAFPTDGQEVQSVVATPAAEATHALSPDGKWLAYTSDESGAWEVYVQPFPDGGRRVTVSSGGGGHPLWSPDGQVLYFRQGTSMLAVDVTTDPEFDHGPPYELFDIEIHDEGNRQFDISPDGEQFLMIETDRDEAVAQRINVVLNWFEELKELVPAGR